MNTEEKTIKGFVQWANEGQESYYWHDGRSVWRSSIHSVLHENGYRAGRWECSVDHWNHYAQKLNRTPIRK